MWGRGRKRKKKTTKAMAAAIADTSWVTKKKTKLWLLPLLIPPLLLKKQEHTYKTTQKYK
jgi:hypothetical protein